MSGKLPRRLVEYLEDQVLNPLCVLSIVVEDLPEGQRKLFAKNAITKISETIKGLKDKTEFPESIIEIIEGRNR